MNKQKWIYLIVALVMMAGAGAMLTRLKASQKLGRPGIKTSPIAESIRLNVYLPKEVLHYDSTNIPTDPGVLEGLPHDTSFGQRLYQATNDPLDWLQLMAVLMGTDRTSIHKPQFCLKGSGWDFDEQHTTPDVVRVQKPYPYDLPVTRIVMSRVDINSGVTYHGIYIYWFVADGQLTGSHFTRMWNTATHLLKTGELHRWAYIGCLGVCRPGEEDATYERMKKFIAAAVPEFQLTTGAQVQDGAQAALNR